MHDSHRPAEKPDHAVRSRRAPTGGKLPFRERRICPSLVIHLPRLNVEHDAVRRHRPHGVVGHVDIALQTAGDQQGIRVPGLHPPDLLPINPIDLHPRPDFGMWRITADRRHAWQVIDIIRRGREHDQVIDDIEDGVIGNRDIRTNRAVDQEVPIMYRLDHPYRAHIITNDMHPLHYGNTMISHGIQPPSNDSTAHRNLPFPARHPAWAMPIASSFDGTSFAPRKRRTASGIGNRIASVHGKEQIMTPPELLMMARIRWGMNVCDSEGVKIGTVEKIYRAADYGTMPSQIAPTIVQPYLRVASDGKQLYIPSSSISDVTDDCVVLNVVQDRIAEQGWDLRPDFIQG